MNWIFTPKHAGKPLPEIEVPFNGTRDEAYTRAKNLAAGLVDLFGKKKFSVHVHRSDRPAKDYEVGPDGSTVD